MSTVSRSPGVEAVRVKGRWAAYRWLVYRRLVQFGILALFLAGPWAGVWIVKGNLGSSLVLDTIPLTDPYILMQSLFARHGPELTAVMGALVVIAIYVLFGGRTYCAWVCPINAVTDTAQWLRRRLRLKGGARLSPATRYWLLGASLLVAAVTGTIAWELLNPVSMVFRGLVFGMGAAWFVILAVFLFDLLVSERGWCGHLCPVGAFYSIPGRVSVVRVSAADRERCNDCADCLKVCPEPQVLKLPVFSAGPDTSPVVLSPNCTNCGRCIDVCTEDVFHFSTRFSRARHPESQFVEETQS